MIVLLEEQESWSLMMLVSAVAIDNADISFEGKEAIRRWRSDHQEGCTRAGSADRGFEWPAELGHRREAYEAREEQGPVRDGEEIAMVQVNYSDDEINEMLVELVNRMASEAELSAKTGPC